MVLLLALAVLALCTPASAQTWCVAPWDDVIAPADNWYAENGGAFWEELIEPTFCQNMDDDGDVTRVYTKKLQNPSGWWEVAFPCMTPPAGGGSLWLVLKLRRDNGNAVLNLDVQVLVDGQWASYSQPTVVDEYQAVHFEIPTPMDWSGLRARFRASKSGNGGAPTAHISALGLWGFAWAGSPGVCE